VKELQFTSSIADGLNPFVGTVLDMQGIEVLIGYADRYDSKLVKEARMFSQKGRGYEKIAKHISEKTNENIPAQTIWFWVNKRNKYVRI